MAKKVGVEMIILIIGGGASGMAAALAAAENPENRVLLLERQARVGRKLQATGNGRCNLTNLRIAPEHYHGMNPAFAKPALAAFDSEQTRNWFRRLGLFTTAESGGRVYPYSDQANSVVDVLRFGLQRSNLTLITGCEVTKLKKTATGFRAESHSGGYDADRVIVACGGLAGTKLGGSMAGYQLLRGLGHGMTKLRPALVQLKCDWNGTTSLKGVRCNCRAEIRCDGEVKAAHVGEMQWTEYGLSGPVIFEVSRDVCQGTGDWVCQLDLFPDSTETEVMTELKRRRQTALPAEELLTGILHNRLGRVLTQDAGIRLQTPVALLEDWQLAQVVRRVKALNVPLTGTMGMDSAQVTAGGARTDEFCPETMESRLVNGLYACGEVLDIDGDCGGYNLQWACSGRLAGLHAGEVKI